MSFKRVALLCGRRLKCSSLSKDGKRKELLLGINRLRNRRTRSESALSLVLEQLKRANELNLMITSSLCIASLLSNVFEASEKPVVIGCLLLLLLFGDSSRRSDVFPLEKLMLRIKR